jgi:hypothetical protein
MWLTNGWSHSFHQLCSVTVSVVDALRPLHHTFMFHSAWMCVEARKMADGTQQHTEKGEVTTGEGCYGPLGVSQTWALT